MRCCLIKWSDIYICLTDEIHMKLQEGYDDAQAGRVQEAVPALEE